MAEKRCTALKRGFQRNSRWIKGCKAEQGLLLLWVLLLRVMMMMMLLLLLLLLLLRVVIMLMRMLLLLMLIRKPITLLQLIHVPASRLLKRTLRQRIGSQRGVQRLARQIHESNAVVGCGNERNRFGRC
jgi:hypothetical protein